MASIAPENFDSAFLRDQVRATYDQVARNPHGDYHFHRGPQYAHTHLGYNLEELDQLPEECTVRFAGVGNPIRIGESEPDIVGIRPGETVLDHACGAGMDLLLAAKRVGPSGQAIGVDMTPAMRECATAGAELAGMSHIVDIREGFFEDLPVAGRSVDVVISNGVVNLSPDKAQVFREIYRVLKPGGRLFMADVVVQRELTLDARSDPTLWAACVGGAMVENEVAAIAADEGLCGGRVVQRFNCFYNTMAEAKVAKDLFVHAVNFYAYKPEKHHVA